MIDFTYKAPSKRELESMFYRTTSVGHRASQELTRVIEQFPMAKQCYEELLPRYKSRYLLNKSLLKTSIAIGAYYMNNPQRFGHEPPKSYVFLRAFKGLWSLHKVTFGDCGRYREVPNKMIARNQEQFWNALEQDMRVLRRKVDDIESQRDV